MGAEAPDPGRDGLRRVRLFQAVLLALGTLLWALLRSRTAAWTFFVGGATSLAFWELHGLFVSRMLTPKVRLRWLYGFLTLLKLALIIVVLRGMMDRYPAEALPLGTGLLLFVAAIFMEAARLAARGPEPPEPPQNGPWSSDPPED